MGPRHAEPCKCNVDTHRLNTPAGAVWGGETKTFNTLRDAIRFVMTELTESDRATAWIAVDGQTSLQIQEIGAIYKEATFPR